ncbi:MAG TPA: aminodeoxychorismate/anthranilate synthase component II [Thermomicrobiales bacterium]|nr:aminodeoxychorismate/anthranilate synthase component II [Thermomicrobiales bacterium]
MIYMLDNYDSFTFNLYQAFAELGADVLVERNDQTTIDAIEARLDEIDGFVISPGPCSPAEAGISVDLIRAFAGRKPILGVCLGHQSIGAAYGGSIVHAPSLMHGKTSQIEHDGKGVFEGLPNPFVATRYHSLTIEPSTIPTQFEVTATSDDGVIQGIRHRELPIEGVQFHPESILTIYGKDLLANFLRSCGAISAEAETKVPVLGY